MAQFEVATGSTAAALACVVHPGSGPGSPALAVVEALEAATQGALGSTPGGGGKSMSPVALASAMKALHAWYPAGVPDERSARAVSTALTESSVLAGTPPEVWVEGARVLRSPPLPGDELLKVLETGHRKRQMVTMLASCRLLGRSESTPEARQFLAATMNDPASEYSACLAKESGQILAGVPAAEREEWSRRLQEGVMGQQDPDSQLEWIQAYQRFETDPGRWVDLVGKLIASPDPTSQVKAMTVIAPLKRNDLPPEARAALEAAVAADPVLQRNVQYYSR